MSAWKPSVFGRFDQLEQLDHCASSCACRPSRFRLRRRAARRSPRRRRTPGGTSRRSSSCCRPDPSPSRPGSRPSRCGRRRTGGCRARAASCAMRQALRTCVRKFCRSSSLAHRRAAAGRRPDRRDERADDEILARAILSASRFRSSSVASMLTCGSNRNRSTPSNFDAVDLGRGRQVEHRVEIDRRLGSPVALADEAGPHGVVKCGIFVHAVSFSCQLVSSPTTVVSVCSQLFCCQPLRRPDSRARSASG